MIFITKKKNFSKKNPFGEDLFSDGIGNSQTTGFFLPITFTKFKNLTPKSKNPNSTIIP